MDELTEKDLLYVLDSVQAIDYNEERSDKELEILREMGYFEHAESLLLEAGIPTADVKEGLDENQFYQLKTLFNIPPDLRYVAPESKIPAIATLNSIADQSKQLRYPAKAENMKAKWAKEYYSGYYAQYKTQVNKALESGKSAASTGAGEFDREGRPYYYRIVHFGSIIGECWGKLPNALDKSASEKGIAQDTYDACDKALDQYWVLLDKFAVGLRQEEVVHWVGDIFRKLLETHSKLFKACKPKTLATVKPLGGENVKKVEEWTAKTEEKLAAALKAAQG